MTTPTGAISFANLQSEFGGSNPISLSEYYSGGSLLGAPLNNVAASGAINMNSLRNVDKRSGSGNQVNVRSGLPNATSCIFTTSGDCYSNATGTAALTVPSGASGATTVVINHNIAGKGGNGGAGQAITYYTIGVNTSCTPTGSAGNGAGGGPALSLGSPTFVDNNAAVRSGSGGGGGGSAFGGVDSGALSNGITCDQSNLKGIILNNTGYSYFLVGSAGGGGGGGNSNITNSADGSGGGAGGGGDTANFSNGNKTVWSNSNACALNSSYYSSRRVKMIASNNAGGTPGGGSSGFPGTNGGSGGSDGNAGAATNASGTTSHATLSENGVNYSGPTTATGSPDGGSAGGAGLAFQGWNNQSTSANGISSTQGTYTGGVS